MSAGSEEKVSPPFCFPDIEWVKGSSSSLPEGVIKCGKYNGSDMYAARLYHKGELLIGSVIKPGVCTYSKDGIMHETSDYEIMTVPVGEPLTWINVSADDPLLEDPIIAGLLKNEQTLRVGRIVKEGNTLVGWIDKENVLHVFHGDKEETATDFEVLVHKFAKFLCICPPCPRSE